MPKRDRYADMTTEDFDRLLHDVIANESATSLLQVPGVYEVLSEYYNNDVLEAWEIEREIERDARKDA